MYSFVCQGYLPPWIQVLILSYFVIFCPAPNPLSPESSKNSQIVSLLYSYVCLGLFFRHQQEWACYKPCERLQCPSSEPSGPLSLSAIAAMCRVGACGCLPRMCVTSALTAVLLSLLSASWAPHSCRTTMPRSCLNTCALAIPSPGGVVLPDVCMFSLLKWITSESLFLALSNMRWSHPVYSFPRIPNLALFSSIEFISFLTCFISL